MKSLSRRLAGGRSPRTGFTLVEVIIAVCITGIILGTIYASYFNVVKTIRHCRQKIKKYKIVHVFFDKLKDDINCVYDSENEDTRFAGKSDQLEIVSTNSLGFSNSNKSDLRVIKYFVNPAEKGKLDVCRKEDGVKFCFGGYFNKFKLSYYDKRKWMSDWDPEWTGKIPEGVKVEISIETEEGESADFSSVFEIPCSK